MASDRWLSFQELVDIVQDRLRTSIGNSEKIVREAQVSGEVRRQRADDPNAVFLLPDDGIIGMDLRPGAQNKGGDKLLAHPLPSKWSQNDFWNWLDRRLPPKVSSAETRTTAKVKAKTACTDWLTELRRKGPPKKTKTEYQNEASKLFGVGPDQFRQVWDAAAIKTPRDDWGAPGRRRKPAAS
jgi:hypothetical protein